MTGAVYGSGRATALLLPRSVLPDARRRHPALYLRVRCVPCSSHS